MSEYASKLTKLVTGVIDDIIFDYVNRDTPVKTEIKTKALEVVEVGEDDGCVSGLYTIIVNGGQFTIDLIASARFKEETDCWDCGSESHYTREIFYDDLEDFSYTVEFLKIDNGRALDKAIEADIKSSREKKHD